MKTLINKIAFVAIAALLLVSNSFAASDYLLELDGVKGECKGKHIKLTENSDGSFTAEGIPAGTYNVVYKAKQGKSGSAKRSAAGGGPHVLAFEYEVKAPRDVATGQSSGKRQHKPVTISKEWDASTPTLILGQVTVGDLDGDGVDAKTKSTPQIATYDLVMAKKV